MPKRRSAHPTEAELEILNVLWRLGPSTVRCVHEALQADRTTGLTTTLKLLQVMAVKGLVRRDDSAYPDRYAAALPQAKAQVGMLKDLVTRAFDGSVGKMLIRAVEEGGLTKEELSEIRKLLDNPRKR
jgi:BlaI family transcriptional regulator, penicillinase repressor